MAILLLGLQDYEGADPGRGPIQLSETTTQALLVPSGE